MIIISNLLRKKYGKSMNILDLIDTKVSAYTKTDRIIYEKLKKFPDIFVENSYTDIVKGIDVSPAALTRFAKKLGFSGFNEFQFQLSVDLHERTNKNTGSKIAEKFGKVLISTEESINQKQLTSTAKKIINAKQIICLGFNSSSLPARFLWDTLRSEFRFDAQMTEYDYIFSKYTNQDIIILFSVSSGSFYNSFLQTIRKMNPEEQPYVILVTMNIKHPLRKKCDDVILLPSAGGMYQSHAAVLENMIFMMFNDLLVTKIRNLLNEK